MPELNRLRSLTQRRTAMRNEPGDAHHTKVTRRLLGIVVVVVILPLLAAAASQIAIGSDYHAVGDLADIELHTRDVGRHRVELGQYSRGDWSHPGPAQFYALALPYRLSGSTSIGNNLGALLINALSMVGILLLARRRGGVPLLLTAGVGCLLLVRSFGPDFLIEPWNPSMPVLPFGLFLFLVWDMMCGRAWAIPSAAVIGTFCVQTHIGYAPLVLPLAAIGLATFLWAAVRTRDQSLARIDRRSLTWVFAITGGVLVLMWAPPVMEELRPGEGNLTRAIDYFLDGEGEEHTLADGYANVAIQYGVNPEWITGNLRLTAFTSEPDVTAGAPLPVMLLPVLLGTAVWWRRRSADALRLVAVTTVAAGISVLAISRTLGPIYHYRLGWTRVVAMAALLSAVWALWGVLVDRWPWVERRVLVPVALVVLVGLAAAIVPRFARSGPPLERISEEVAELAPEMARDLPPGDGPVILRCDGDEGCIYLAGFVLWFERRGIDARVDNPNGVIASGAPHRLYGGGPVRAVLHVALNAQFYARAAAPDAEVVAYRGDAPTPERGQLGKEILALIADREAGRIGRTEYFYEWSDRIDRMGSAIGVMRERFER